VLDWACSTSNRRQRWAVLRTSFSRATSNRGAQGNPQVPAFLQNLASNTRMPVFQATGTPANVLSAGSIANQLTGGGGGGAGFNRKLRSGRSRA